MAKEKLVYVCGECGLQSSRWQGKCPECSAWNSFAEEVTVRSGKGVTSNLQGKVKPQRLSEIEKRHDARIGTGISELDRVLSGGIVQGSLTLIAGDPGIGKSTLLLQICETIGKSYRLLYVSGEESAAQIKMRAQRLGISTDSLFVLSENNIEHIEAAISDNAFDFLIIDSIQTMQTDMAAQAAGSVTQVRECTSRLMKIAKHNGIAVVIVGHATKEGSIAGPKIMEHMVDTVLYFEGERYLAYRVLRAVKNRFGGVNEIGVFEMKDTGLEEISNPSEYMLSGRTQNLPGSVVTPVLEGTRPIVTEIQALVSPTSFPMPKRSAIGVDFNRAMLLVAVLEKRLWLKLGTYDIYVNVAGGIRVTEPAADLAVVAAILSSYRNKAVDAQSAFFGEVGLSGEVRAVAYGEKRINEASKLGFKRCVMPMENARALKSEGKKFSAEIIGVATVSELFDLL